MKERRGICPVCGKEGSVTIRGAMRMHNIPPEGARPITCEGTGFPPKSYVFDEAEKLAAAMKVVAAAYAWRAADDISEEVLTPAGRALRAVLYQNRQILGGDALSDIARDLDKARKK